MPFDWINEFMSLTESLRSPESFRLWSAISTISSTLERRAGTVTDAVDPLYPNQYIVLAGNPASGKGMVISFSRYLLSDLAASKGGIFIGPDNPTKASFLKQFEKSQKLSINGMGVPLYSAMYVMCRELSVLISKYDREFISDLTDIWDCPRMYTSPRTSTEGARVEAPCLNILAAVTPTDLGDIIPEAAWSTGFTARCLFIYGAGSDSYRDMFTRVKFKDTTILKDRLKEYFHDLHGEFIWDDDAAIALRHWFNEEKQAPVPTYGRLSHYIGRRNEHLMKLSMVSAVSAGHGLSVTLSDLNRAKVWLFAAEETMPDIFRSMHAKSDQQLLTDAHHWLYVNWSTPKLEDRIPIPDRDLYDWFSKKVTHDKVDGMIKLMERTGRMRKATLLNGWIPNTFDKFVDF